MMELIANQNLTRCQVNSPTVSAEERKLLLVQIPQWNIIMSNAVQHLNRSFSFPDFGSALAFSNLVGELAQSFGHHPAILIEWGKVEVSWWTHLIHGLHGNDFIMAAKTDALYEAQSR